MPQFICPVCRGILRADEKVFSCSNGHSYDVAKQGYINLLMSNKPAEKRHGDDALMVRARTRFLSKGYYSNLFSAVADAVCEFLPDGGDVLDAGCGECSYTAFIADALKRTGKACDIAGIDISKDALKGAKRFPDIRKAVGSIFALPVGDSSCDVVINIFAPLCESEFMRVLRPGGVLIRAVPLEKHLLSLKRAVYDEPYLNKPADAGIPGLSLVKSIELRNEITVEGDDVSDLFMMTPYYYKTSAEDQAKLNTVRYLKTETEFGVFIYRKD